MRSARWQQLQSPVPASSTLKKAAPAPTEARVRLNLDLDPKVKAQLEALRIRSGASSISEVIRRSIALYDLVIQHQSEGGTLVFKHSDETEESLRLL